MPVNETLGTKWDTGQSEEQRWMKFSRPRRMSSIRRTLVRGRSKSIAPTAALLVTSNVRRLAMLLRALRNHSTSRGGTAMAIGFLVCMAPDSHISFLQQHPGYVHSYLDGAAPPDLEVSSPLPEWWPKQ